MRLRATSLSSRQKPLFTYRRMEQNMLAAVRAAGGAAWYMPDDFLTLGPELVSVPTASVAGTSGYFYTDFVPAVGKSYLITYQYSVTGGTSVQMSLGGSNVPSSTVGSGSVIYTITATNTNPLRCYSNAATATLGGISVKEVLSAKDFQDSAGTLPSYLGGTVGLGLDATGMVGAELMPTYDFTSASWTAIGTPSGVTPNSFTNASGTTAGLIISAATLGLVTGKTYRVSIPYTKSESSSAISMRIAAGIDIASAGAATGVLTGVAVAGTTGLQLRYTNNGTVTFGAISVKEITGNHVTQATAGNRPTITRIPRKLGPELVTNGGGNTTDGWSARIGGVLSSVSGKLRITTPAGNADRVISLTIPTVAGKDYVLSMTGYIGTLVGYWAARVSSTSDGATSVAASSNQTTSQAAVSVQFKGTGADVYAVFVAVGNATGQYGEFDDVSLREVLEWSNALTFDGTNDSLATAASVIGATLTQPYTMIAWGKVGALGAARRLVGDSARSLGVATTSRPYATNHGVVNANAVTTMVAGQSVILESTWDGAMLAIYVNGTKEGEIASAAPAVPAGPTAIAQRGSGVEYWNSEIGGVVVCPAVMTDAQRTAVRKFAAAQMGLSI